MSIVRHAWPHRGLELASLAAATLLAACSTSGRVREYREAYSVGNFEKSAETLQELCDDDSDNAHIYQLEGGMVELARRLPQASLPLFRRARDRMDQLAESDYNGWFESVLLDERQLDYPGADFEHVIVRAMLAVSDLMNGGSDANAYALQVLERQLQIRDSFNDSRGQNPKLNYKLVAFGSYLSAILNEESPLRLDEARRLYGQVLELEPGFPFAKEDLARVTEGKHSEKGNGVVHVLALIGRGPYRVERAAPVTGSALAIIQAIWQLHRGGVVFPNITAVKIPALAFHSDNPSSAHVYVDGVEKGVTATITDVSATAQSEFRAMEDHIIGRAALRRAFKIVTTEVVKEAVVYRKGKKHWNCDECSFLLDLVISLFGNVWTALEEADLRCWSLLPATFQVLRLELPAGEHEITLRAADSGAVTGAPQSVRVSVRDGFNSYVCAIIPTRQGGPAPLTSDIGLPMEVQQ